MFEEFSFDATRSPSLDSTVTITTSTSTTHSRSVSPCSAISAWPAPSYSITDLAADLQRQRLRQDSAIYSQACDTYANLDDDAGWTLEEQETADLPATLDTRSRSTRSYSPARRRLDRQSHSKLLCNATHRSDIAALVSRMVHREDQCSIQPPTSASLTPTCEEDDLLALTTTASNLSMTRSRRTSDLYRTDASISKDSRRKRDLPPRRQKSSDSK